MRSKTWRTWTMLLLAATWIGSTATLADESSAQIDGTIKISSIVRVQKCQPGFYWEGRTCCPTGFKCKDAQDLASIDRAFINLELELDKARLQRLRRIGVTAGVGLSCGPGLNHYPVELQCTPGVAVTFGWRF